MSMGEGDGMCGRWLLMVGFAGALMIGACGGGGDTKATTTPAAATQTATQAATATPSSPATATVTVAPPTPTATPTPTPQASTVKVEESVTVLANSFGLPNTTGYSTVVAFHVTNTDKQRDAVNVPYRVTVNSGDKALYESSGRDTISIKAGQTRLVVFTGATGIEGAAPDSAQVRVYPDPTMFPMNSRLPDPAQWQTANRRLNCSGGLIACNATGDLTWTGDKPQTNVRIMIAMHTGGANGPIVGAGAGTLQQTDVAPSQTLPFEVTALGFVQPVAKQGLQLPSEPLTGELYIESLPR